MVCYTKKSYIRQIDVSKREIRSIGSTKKLDDALKIEGASIFDLRISHDNSKLLMIVNYPKTTEQASNLIVVWNIERDILSKIELVEEPLSVAWEMSDSRFFGALVLKASEEGAREKSINTFFIGEKNNIMKHDSVSDSQTE
jgi:hypothetical protein